MTVELTTEDLKTIESWYQSASGESATECNTAMFALLEKLSIHATRSDLYPPNPDDWREPYRSEVVNKVAAIRQYSETHPDYDEVTEAAEDWLDLCRKESACA